jgi:methionine-rich copper-binding protein CopC
MYKKIIALMLLVVLISTTSSPLIALGKDQTAPTVVLTIPASGETNIEINQKIKVTFSEQMNPLKFNKRTFIVLQEGTTTQVLGKIRYSTKNKKLIFRPKQPLIKDVQYTVTIKGDTTTGPNVKDTHGNAMENDYVWTFRTGPKLNIDSISPTVQLVSPSSGSANIATNRNFGVSFSEAIDPLTINATTFTLKQGTTSIPGTVTYYGTIATFHPTSNLPANSNFTATITNQVKDLAGNPLASDFVWNFTTGNTTIITTSSSTSSSSTSSGSTSSSSSSTSSSGSTSSTSSSSSSGGTSSSSSSSSSSSGGTSSGSQQATIDLGAAGSTFAILAGSTVTNTGPTIINGDLGLSPGSAVTGFPPGSVNGTQHINDATSTQAKLDLTTAYNEAAGRSTAPITVSGNLGGQTLAPGLYKSTSTLAISGGDLTLDAMGDGNAVFVFQIASTLTTTPARQVILSGGAMASNIYWQVGTSATIGTTSAFKGNILADQSITFQTGATLDGRALTRIGAVSLDSNIITKP